jgi:glycosyltransferase involved in cell wall biosynthesis
VAEHPAHRDQRRLFERVVIVAPRVDGPPPSGFKCLERTNIELRRMPRTGGPTPAAKAWQLLTLPRLIWSLVAALRGAEAVQVRCPGNLGLLGVLLVPLLTRRMVAKYAGAWSPYPGEPWSRKVQRLLLASRWWRGPVTVYGRRPGQPAHVVPFFNAVLSADHIRGAKRSAPHRELRVLYVGRLSRAKNVDALLHAVAQLERDGLEVDCRIVGEGPQRPALEGLAGELDLSGRVRFLGGLSLEKTVEQYRWADALVLVSRTEGWPKVVLEAMAFGLVCVASDSGTLRMILAEGRGILVPVGGSEEVASALRELAAEPERFVPTRRAAAAWAGRYTIERLAEALRRLLADGWCRQST